MVNEEFCTRLSHDHNPVTIDLVLQPDDLMKITTNLLEYGQMHETLKNGMIDYIAERVNTLTFEVTAELAVIYAMKMDETYKGLFFKKMQDKFMKEIRYLKDETMYKIVWSMVKSQSVNIASNSDYWNSIKVTISERAAEIDPKIMSDLLVLSTMEASADENKSDDLFSKVEGELMSKMKLMSLDDLINLLWTALKIDRGSGMFFERLEKELAKRIRTIKDEQYETLLQCFIGEKSDKSLAQFSSKFMDLVIRVIMDKRDRFALKTIVSLMWSCARIDFTNENH